ncbi:MAG TPA: hypothetical protein VNK05_17610 [Chloroflexota bacterium]|jgi:hypothetical protein|nr:hypothetical protein [Chloroflexota bacterium]
MRVPDWRPWGRGGAGQRRPRAEARRCPSCGQDRPAAHAYCFACGARLFDRTVPSNASSFKESRVPLWHSRVVGLDQYPERSPLSRRLLGAGVRAVLCGLALVGALTLVNACQTAPGLSDRLPLPPAALVR